MLYPFFVDVGGVTGAAVEVFLVVVVVFVVDFVVDLVLLVVDVASVFVVVTVLTVDDDRLV